MPIDKRRSKTKKAERSRRALTVNQQETIEKASSPQLSQAIDDFINAKIAERTAERTLKDYARHLRYMQEWLEQHHDVRQLIQVTQPMLREYIAWMTYDKEQYEGHPFKPKAGRRGLSPATVNIRIRTMKAFFNWCLRNGYIRVSPMDDIKQQKVDVDAVTGFTDVQIRKLLDAPDTSTFVGFRDYVIMMTLLDTGLRISELFSLTKADVDFDNLTLTVPWEKAKTRRKRTVPISSQTAKLLLELMRENDDFGPDVQHLFLTGLGDPLSPMSFDDRLKLYGEQSGVSQEISVSAHKFRHTFAIQWIKAGGDPFSLQKILGHTDMSMVRRYVQLSQSDVSDKHQKFSPIKTLLNNKKDRPDR